MILPVVPRRCLIFERLHRLGATILAHAVMAVNIRNAAVKTNTALRPISTLIVKNPAYSGVFIC